MPASDVVYIGVDNQRVEYTLPYIGKGFFDALPGSIGRIPIELLKPGLQKYQVRSFENREYTSPFS
ncbi:hypothetical protein [Taibaiella helva]|uniref:hypothetical protein n=1 Tax=Taibaiella helva TaxID=2301235 RepID=UPI001E632AE9|nr:hypothetical protein [Taibaiella helva]